MTTVAVVAHHERPDVVDLVEETMAWLSKHGHDGWLLPDDGAELDLAHHADDRPLSDAQIVICLGGDGTMLRARECRPNAHRHCGPVRRSRPRSRMPPSARWRQACRPPSSTSVAPS